MVKKIYTCPMHLEIKKEKQGRCPKCRMELIQSSELKTKNHDGKNLSGSYKPVYIVIGLIFVSSIAISYPWFTLTDILRYFMAGVFLVFAGFKLIDLKGFAQGYSTYDLLAMRWFFYGYIYPFIELFFGLSMIIGLFETQILWAELIVMSFSGLGVLIKILKKESFQCVCLGTFLKVPLTKVTLIEDFGMTALAALLLYLL